MEQNTPRFEVGEFFQLMFLVGLPVYLSFWMQGLLIYWIKDVTVSFMESEFCFTDTCLQIAVVSVFFIFLYPSVKSIYVETYVILRSTRVAFMHENTEDRILLYEMFAPMSKRLTMFFLIPFIESCILLALFFIGTDFILSAEDVSDLIINSVAIAFIMDIDNLAREFFQNVAVTEHVDGMHFETKMQANDNKLTTLDDLVDVDEDHDDELVNPSVVATFWSIDRVVGAIFMASCYVLFAKSVYCLNKWN